MERISGANDVRMHVIGKCFSGCRSQVQASDRLVQTNWSPSKWLSGWLPILESWLTAAFSGPDDRTLRRLSACATFSLAIESGGPLHVQAGRPICQPAKRNPQRRCDDRFPRKSGMPHMRPSHHMEQRQIRNLVRMRRQRVQRQSQPSPFWESRKWRLTTYQR